jgi:hypothetical protein
MDKTEAKPNWFIRCGIILLVLFLAAIVVVSFLGSPPPYRITAGILTVLAMMIILILSEAFNSFSLGKLLTLSREVEKTAGEKEDIKRENAELRQSLVHVATHVQSQVNTTIQAHGADLLRALGVVRADKEAKEEEDKEEATPEAAPQRPSAIPSYRLMPQIDAAAIGKYAQKYGLPQTEIVRDIRFNEAFECIDPISNRSVSFDGYLKTPVKESFFEVKVHRSVMGSMLWDRLHVMLSKILLYRQAKKINAELILILVRLPDESHERPGVSWERFMELYQPAIACGLLKVETFTVSEDEYRQIEAQARQERAP